MTLTGRIQNLRTLFQLTCLAIVLSCAMCMSQPPSRVDNASVRLEPHEGKSAFKIGDPVILDLVFTSRSPGAVVKTGDNPYRPVSDRVDVSPDGGWIRTHAIFRGQGTDGNALSNLSGNPIRVPILLNRTITFLKPGHYEVTVTTERLRNSSDIMTVTPLEDCEPCRKTNAVGIDISEMDDSEESVLVASLSRDLEDTAKPLENKPSPESKALAAQVEEELTQHPSVPDPEKLKALTRKMGELISDELSSIQKRADARHETAVRLACLEGDDAMRAKVHFIAAEDEFADPNIAIAWILVDGLANSRNKQLQLALLEDAWRNPNMLPTDPLQSSLRQARELTQKDWVTDDSILWAGTPEEHQAAKEEYQRELNEIIASLPQRSESNRAETIKYLKSLGFPNPFNQRPGP